MSKFKGFLMSLCFQTAAMIMLYIATIPNENVLIVALFGSVAAMFALGAFATLIYVFRPQST